jgi:ABC-type sugar transport system permease subunit
MGIQRLFDLIYSLTKGGPGTSTETMSLVIWRQAFSRYDIGVSSALSVVMFLLLMGLSVVILRRNLVKKEG